jgi:hypothetical protein
MLSACVRCWVVGLLFARRSGTLLVTGGRMLVALLIVVLGAAHASGQERVIYSQGFESSNGGFTTDVGNATLWGWGTPTVGPGGAHSGTKAWGNGLTQNAGAGTSSITSPAIPIPALQPGQVARVTFWLWINISMYPDRGRFLTSSDGSTFNLNAEFFMDMGGGGGWKPYSFDVTAFNGGNLYLKFLTYTGSTGVDGMYVDDISVTVFDTPGDRRLLQVKANEQADGSCPWLLPWNGTTYQPDNDIYSVARFQTGEYTDYYRVQQPLLARNGRYPFEIRELDTEQSWTDWIQLQAIDHAADVQIAPDNAGGIHAWRPATLISPTSATGAGTLGQVVAADDAGIPLYSGDQTVLHFGAQNLTGGAHLVLRARGFLDGTGEDRPFIGPPAIVVEVLGADGQWREAGRYKPRYQWGVEAYDLSPFVSGPVDDLTVRLTCISHEKKYHEVDFVGLAAGPEPNMQVTVQPLAAAAMGQIDLRAKLSAIDKNYVHTTPGQAFDIEFETLAQTGEVRDFVFASRGYYIPGSGTFFVYTWDGTQWAMRDGYSFPATDATKTFDLSLFLPDVNGEYKVRLWQDYSETYAANIDFVGMTVDGVAGTMSEAQDLRQTLDSGIMALVNSSDNAYFSLAERNNTWSRDRWSEYAWSGFTVNRPPTVSSVSFGDTGAVSWTYSDPESTPQAAFQVQVWTGGLGTGTIFWDPGLVTGSATTVYTGQALTAGTTYYVRVKASDGSNWSSWAETSFTAPSLTSYALAVSKTGAGSGTVTSSPIGVDCGTSCTVSFIASSVVTLTATQAVGSTFTGWSGEGCSGTGTCVVTMSQARNVTADFSSGAPSTFSLTVTPTGTGTGTVTSAPTGIDCGSTCTANFTYNSSVTLTASAGGASTFGGWSGAGCSGTGTCTVTMSQARSVIATFTSSEVVQSQTITFAALSNRALSASPFTVSATASSGLTVSFASTTAGVCSVSGTSVTLLTAGTCTIRASQAGNGSYSAAANVDRSFEVYSAPTVTGVAPASGPAAGGTAVTITGTAFRTGATVTIGGTAATSVVVVSATSITAATPAHAAGAADVVVTNSDTQAGTLSSGFTFYAAPTVTLIAPASGPTTGSTAVTITGTAFRTGATVTIGGTAATSVVVVSATSITATTPAHVAGAADVVVTNSDTQAGTLAAGFTYSAATHYYLAEGATVWTFDTLLAFMNPGADAAPVTVTFMKDDGSTVETTRTVAAGSRDTLRVGDVPGMTGVSFGTVVTSTAGVPLVVERLMTWDDGHGAHSGTATDTLSTSWYFAEGAQQPLDTYLLLANPGETAAEVTVTFLLTGATPVVRILTVDPHRRATIWGGLVPELVQQSFSMTVQASQPIVAERSLYFGATRHWDGGTSAMGVIAPSADWYFAEGSTGPFFDMYLLLGNPNVDAADVNVTYLLDDGTTIPKTYPVTGQSRVTIFVPSEAPGLAQAGGVGVEVHATRPVLAERAMYWMPGYLNWRDGHASAGSPTTGSEWAFAEGAVGGTNSTQTYLLLANPGATASEVQITYVREAGLPPVVKTYTVGATSRLTVWVNGVTELSNERFGAIVAVTSGSAVVAERSMYWDKDGTWWAAGTAALGTRLR